MYTKKGLVPALIQCHFDSWYSGLSRKKTQRSHAKQNYQILNASHRSQTDVNEFKQVGLLPVEVRVDQRGNYRAVSILHVFSKVVEKVVHNQLSEYLILQNLLYQFQPGFRSAFSTDTCLIHQADHVKNECDQGSYTGMVFLDLQKAFDTVNNDILLAKLKRIRGNDVVLQWFKSCLKGGSRVADLDGCISASTVVTCGVPQGSILGPLLFLICANDISSPVACELLPYADDAVLLVSGKDISTTKGRLTMELESVYE